MADKIEENKRIKKMSPSALIKEIILKWIDQQNFPEKYHPDTVITNRTVNIFNDNVMANF